MTITVKLDPALEQRLRQSAAGAGLSTSEVIRAALVAYLNQTASAEAPSPYDLGSDLFGRFGGDPELAVQRKRELAESWSAKHDARE